MESIIIDKQKKKGFFVTEEYSAIFRLRPDLVFQNGNEIKSFLFRKTNTIPEDFIERYSETTTIADKEIEKYIVFPKKPVKALFDLCVKLNIGLVYMSKGKFTTEKPSNKYSSVELIAEPEPYRMPETHVFLSSDQEIQERKSSKKIIEQINIRYKKAIYPFAVEIDKMTNVMSPEDLKREILEGIKKCEFFLGILNETPSPAVEWEIYRALEEKTFENIVLFVKANVATNKTWEQLIKHIKLRYVMDRKTVWYIPYDDNLDFEEGLRYKIMNLISEIHKKNGATFL